MDRDRLETPFDHASLEAAKWIGLGAMTLDHYGKIVDPDVFTATHAIGRLAFPLLAGIIGVRLAAAPGLADRYLRRLAAWGIVSQPVFVLAGRPWRDGNILLTLALGVVVWLAVEGLATGRRRARAWALLAAVPAAFFTEFGPVGVLMPAATALCMRGGLGPALLAFGPLGLASNVVLEPPILTPIDGWALLATPVALASPLLAGVLPRLPGVLFYAYYPAHLLALHWLDVLTP
jgi:hypothetical protein